MAGNGQNARRQRKAGAERRLMVEGVKSGFYKNDLRPFYATVAEKNSDAKNERKDCGRDIMAKRTISNAEEILNDRRVT